MSHLEPLLRFLVATILAVSLSHSAAAMAPPEAEQVQRVPRAPLTRIPRPAPAPPSPVPTTTPRVTPSAPELPAPASPPLPKPTDCTQMLLKGLPVDLSCCGNPGQVT